MFLNQFSYLFISTIKYLVLDLVELSFILWAPGPTWSDLVPRCGGPLCDDLCGLVLHVAR